jgi:hypothetical protein
VIPRNLLRVFTSYRFGEGLHWSVGGGVNWQSGLWNAAQRPTGALTVTGAPVTVASRIEQGSVWLASLMASYRINDHLTASLNVSNLFDKHYYNRVGFYNGLHYAEPRSVMGTLRASFFLTGRAEGGRACPTFTAARHPPPVPSPRPGAHPGRWGCPGRNGPSPGGRPIV